MKHTSLRFLSSVLSAALAAILFLMPLTACGSSAPDSDFSTSENFQAFGEEFSSTPIPEGTVVTTAPSPEASSAPAPIPTAAPTPSPSANPEVLPSPDLLPTQSPLPSSEPVFEPLTAEPVNWSAERTQLSEDFYQVTFTGDYGLDDLLSGGGVSSVPELAAFVLLRLGLSGGPVFNFSAFGCSTISAPRVSGGYLFGRNFDWTADCTALVVRTIPENGYRSISTVNMNFYLAETGLLTEEAQVLAALYAPLDGMNEKGLCISVNMVGHEATISQDNGLPDITTTTAIRLLLDRAATVDEAVALLEQYDMHESLGTMVHFFLSDATGHSVAVEYLNNALYVTECSAMTNFYMTPGEYYGIGTEQSHLRHELLMDALQASPVMNPAQVRDALASVSRKNFSEYESTEWSAIFDQTALEAVYYHRGNYNQAWRFSLMGD